MLQVERYKPDILAAIHTLFDPAEYEVVWRLSEDRLRQDGWTAALAEAPATPPSWPPATPATEEAEAPATPPSWPPATPATEERGGEKEAKLEEAVMVIEELGVKVQDLDTIS